MVRPRHLPILLAAILAGGACGSGDDGGDDLEALPAAFHLQGGSGTGHSSCGATTGLDVMDATTQAPSAVFTGETDTFACGAATDTADGWSLACMDTVTGERTLTIAVTRAARGTLSLQAGASIRCDWSIVDFMTL